MITDPARAKREDHGHPDICNVYSYHKVFNKPEIIKIGEECKTAGIGCTECKENLASQIIESLQDLRLKRKKLEENPGLIEKILAEGRQRAGEVASQTLREVKSAMKI